MMADGKGIWSPDQSLQEFSTDSFDVEDHATKILKQGNINEEVARLGGALESLDSLIQDHVSKHYSDLLSNAVASSELEQSLTVMSTHIASLQLSTERLRGRVKEPYDKIKAGTTSLARLQETADMLRRVIRILQLSKRLAAAMGGQGETDLGKAASGLAELSDLLQDDLTGLEVVEGEARRARQWRAEVERQAEGLLIRGLATGNQAQLGTGLQVFYNLGTLSGVVGGMVGDMERELKVSWTEGLDIKRISEKSEAETGRNGGRSNGPGKAAMPGPGNMAAFRSSLWSNVDSLLDSLHGHMVKMFHLQRLLCKKVDPVTQQPFLVSLPSPCLVSDSWDRVTAVVKECMAAAQAKSNFVKQACEGEYPKLVRLYTEMWTKVRYTAAQYCPTNVLEDTVVLTNPFLGEEMGQGLRDSLAQFENAYLARSLSRLFDPVNLMFSGSGVPSAEEVKNIFNVMTSELNIAMVENRLLDAVTKNLCKAVALFCVKCEGCVDSEASQVIGQPSASQLQNVTVVNRLSLFGSCLASLCSEQTGVLGQARVVSLQTSAGEVERQMVGATSPLLASVGDSVESILLTVHKEDFSQETVEGKATPAPACSLYMKELQAFLERIARDFLSTFTCSEFLAGQLQPLAESTIQRFVMQGSLVRPLGSAGAMRLASDCAQLEFALSTILGPSGHSAVGPTGLTALGSSYRLLRAFRSLLFLTPEDMASFPGLGGTVPHSTALHLLISRCPEVLPSPASSLGWSLARYTGWLEDHHGERERLLLIQGALEAYVAAARARQDKSFVPQYPVLVQVLQAGLTNCC